tara:strand:+ start:137 stop:1039 length:903 start_codon:yes stop_codon:yes gene_type:complete
MLYASCSLFWKGKQVNTSKKLRSLLKGNDSIVVPGIHDPMSAKIFQDAGFPALFTGGFSLSASTLGVPDIGLLTMSENIERVRRVINAINVPLISDMDTGYGSPINVIRTVEECVNVGVAGIILEDQAWPKKCGHMEGKSVISNEEHVEKIKAAVHARGDSDLVIIARTDSRATHSLEEAIQRGKNLEASGADVIFIEAPQTEEEIRMIGQEIKAPMLINLIEGGKTPNLPISDLESLGFKIILYPLTSIFATAYSMQKLARYVNSKKTTMGYDEILNFSEFEDVVDLQKYKDLDSRFLS